MAYKANYRVEVAGVTVGTTQVKCTETLSYEPGKFEVTAPAGMVPQVSVGDEVKVYSGSDVVFTGKIEKITAKSTPDGKYITLSGYDLKKVLLDRIFHDPTDPTKLYHGYVDVEPADVVRDIAAQAGLDDSGVVNVGTTVTLRFYYENLLQALRHVAEVVGWEFYITADGVLHFNSTIGSSRTIRGEYLLSSVTKTVDYSDIANRIVALGRGVPDEDTQLDIVVIVEDADSISKYGLREKIIIDRRFVSQDTLQAYAQLLLENYKEPKTIIDVKLLPYIDVGVGDTINFSGISGIDETAQYRVIEKTLRIDGSDATITLRLADPISQAAIGRYSRISSVIDEIKRIQSATIYAQGDKVMLNESIGQNATPDYPVKMRFKLPDTTLAIKDMELRVWASYIRHYTLTSVEVLPTDIAVKSIWGIDTDDLWRKFIVQHSHKSTTTYSGSIGEDTSSIATSVDVVVTAPDGTTTSYLSQALPAVIDISNAVTTPGVYTIEVTPNDKAFLELHISGIIFLDVNVA